MNFWCWLFGHRWRFMFRIGDDGKARAGYQSVFVVCLRCKSVCDRFDAYIGEDGQIYEDAEHAESELLIRKGL